ncbi:MAG: histidine phosphatase family protein [Pseudomonadales bacterium]|jgi:broad specificity phosphatase PhoE
MALRKSHCVTTIDLLRHGECQGGEIYRGTTDVLLTDRGWQQMESSLHVDIAHAETPWDRIISSPLQRCRRFAEAKGQALSIPVDCHEGFREMDFGEWEGRPIEEVHRDDAEAVTRFYQDPATVAPPGGESMEMVQGRLLNAWQQVLTQHKGEHLLLVQHGGTIRILLADLLGMPLAAVTRLEIHYASLSRVQIYETDAEPFPKLVFLNKTAREA